jgi:hypothetical protein
MREIAMIGSLGSHQRRPICSYSNSIWPTPEGASRSEHGNGNQIVGFFDSILRFLIKWETRLLLQLLLIAILFDTPIVFGNSDLAITRRRQRTASCDGGPFWTQPKLS